MILEPYKLDAVALLKRPYSRCSMTKGAIAARVRRYREKQARRRMMQQLRNGQGVRTGALAPWGGAL
jgi:hypothetical protein